MMNSRSSEDISPGAEPPQVAQIANRARHAVAAAPVCISRAGDQAKAAEQAA